jgi:hypothetical protein
MNVYNKFQPVSIKFSCGSRHNFIFHKVLLYQELVVAVSPIQDSRNQLQFLEDTFTICYILKIQ